MSGRICRVAVNNEAWCRERDHMRRSHPDVKEKKFVCSMCGKLLATKQNLQRHENGTCPELPSAKRTSRWTTKLKKKYNAERRQKYRDARARTIAEAPIETLTRFWDDKPIYETEDEVKQTCVEDTLTRDTKQEILAAVDERLGRRTPMCVCTTCGEMCLYHEGNFKELADAWFDPFKVSQDTYDLEYTTIREDS